MQKLAINLLLFMLLPMASIIFLFVIPADKQFAYHFIKSDCYNHSDWIYARMHDTAAVDIAFIGSSRTIHAIADSLIETAISGNASKPVHVVNLGYCRFGRNMDFAIVKDLMSAKRIKKLVLEVREDEEPFSHLDFGYIASSADLLRPVFVNPRYFSDSWKGLQMRVEFVKSFLKVRPASAFGQGNPASIYGYGSSTSSLPANQEVPDSPSVNNTGSSVLRALKLNFPRHYIAEIVALAKTQDIAVCFLYLPSYNHSQQAPRELPYYQKFGPVLIPPNEIFSNPVHFMDENHLNDTGSKQLMEWLVQQPFITE
ncbi:MAG: hypothetical protein K1X61_07780 [Chitinophagales bacterium]|nr:hypothetical protein [Chitinophagales bacterium]